MYRFCFVGNVLKMFREGELVVTIDETNVSYYGSKRKKWVNVQKSIIIDNEPNQNTLSATLVIASTQTEIVGFHLLKGSLSQVHFLLFLQDVSKQIAARYGTKCRVTYIFDNLKAHKPPPYQSLLYQKQNESHPYTCLFTGD